MKIQKLETVVICNPKKDVKKLISDYTIMLQHKTDLISHEYLRKLYKIDIQDIGEKTLAYDVKSHKTGYYIVFTWVGTSDDLAYVERKFRIDDEILKFITVDLETVTVKDTVDIESVSDDIENISTLFTSLEPDDTRKISEVSEMREVSEVVEVGKVNNWNALELFFADTHLTNDEKYDILKSRKEEV